VQLFEPVRSMDRKYSRGGNYARKFDLSSVHRLSSERKALVYWRRRVLMVRSMCRLSFLCDVQRDHSEAESVVSGIQHAWRQKIDSCRLLATCT